MLNIIIGAVAGFVTTYIFAKVTNVEFKGSHGVSAGNFMVFMGVVIGASIGFGMTVSTIMNGF